MKTSKYEIVFDHGFGMETHVQLRLTDEEIRGIVKLRNAERGQPVRYIKRIEVVYEGEGEDNGEA